MDKQQAIDTLNCGNELADLCVSRGEIPEVVEAESASADALRLYRFRDGTEVIETNAGIIGEEDEGWAESRGQVSA